MRCKDQRRIDRTDQQSTILKALYAAQVVRGVDAEIFIPRTGDDDRGIPWSKWLSSARRLEQKGTIVLSRQDDKNTYWRLK